eukprot:11180620-Lingulodinium_polyedra.AAC.1
MPRERRRRPSGAQSKLNGPAASKIRAIVLPETTRPRAAGLRAGLLKGHTSSHTGQIASPRPAAE